MTTVNSVTVPGHIDKALRQASQRTGVDFDYLLNTAVRESGLKTDAKSKSSSATGLFQFIDQTWLGMIKAVGPSLGLADQASKIERTSSGRHNVTDQASREEILALRKDAEISALIAGAYTKSSERALERGLSRQATDGELYIAHFLGAQGAVRLIEAVERTPEKSGKDLFPDAAAANRPIFYEKSGDARSVKAVYEQLVARHGNGRVQTAEDQRDAGQIAANAIVVSPAAASFLKPANFAAKDGHAGWGQRDGRGYDLFSDRSGRHANTPSRGEGPLVLSSAQLRLMYEREGGRPPVAAVRNVEDLDNILKPRKLNAQASGLLGPRKPLYDLFKAL